MTCAKKKVTCIIQTKDNKKFVGENACANPQPECPRELGEGYKKCITVCRQSGHAETVAIKMARAALVDLRGAVATVSGIDHVCPDCASKLREAGVEKIIINIQTDGQL